MTGRSRHRSNIGDEIMWLLVYAMWAVIVGCIVYVAVLR